VSFLHLHYQPAVCATTYLFGTPAYTDGVKKVIYAIASSIYSSFSSFFTPKLSLRGVTKAGARQYCTNEPLEPRLLFSTDLVPLALTEQPTVISVVSQSVSQNQPVNSVKTAFELVVIDRRVEDIAPLLIDIATQQSNGRNIVLVEIDAEQDGLAVVSAALEQATQNGYEISALHIVSHGRDGEFELGNETIDQTTLRQNAQVFAGWASAFSTDGDLLIYGCNFAQSNTGQAFARALSELTGADVAANPQATGASALGGDWTLDFVTGSIEASGTLSMDAQSQWQHLLAPDPIDVPEKVNTSFGTNPSTGWSFNDAQQYLGRSVGVAANGDFVVVWYADASDTIKYRNYFADGTAKQATEQSVNKIGNYQNQASIAVAADGSFAIAWQEFRFADQLIVAQQFNADGTPKSNAFEVSQFGYNAQKPSISINDSGQTFVVWQQWSLFGQSIVGRGFYADGSPLPSNYIPIAVPTLGFSFDQTRPSVVLNGSQAIVVWEIHNAGAVNIGLTDFEIGTTFQNQRFFSQGVSLNSAVEHVAPDVGYNKLNGNRIITWQSGTVLSAFASSANTNTAFAIIDENLNRVTFADMPVTANAAGEEMLPKIAVANDGSFIIVQQETGVTDDPSGRGISGRIFNADGTPKADIPEGSFSYVPGDPSYTDNDQAAPSVAWLGGNIIAAWKTEIAAVDIDVYVRRFAPPAPLLLPSLQVSTTGVTDLIEGIDSSDITVGLTAAPTADVIVSVNLSNKQGIESLSSLVFTPLNWNTPQVVRIAAAVDNVIDANTSFVVTLSTATSIGSGYENVPPIPTVFNAINRDTQNLIVVDTVTDVNDGDVTSLANLYFNRGNDGKISLREAILAANNTPNGTGSLDIINFNIPGFGAGTNPEILIATSLPVITDALVIDGKTQPSADASARFITLVGPVLSGMVDAAPNRFPALTLAPPNGITPNSSGSVIRGLAVTGFLEHGITVMSSTNIIEQNYLGFSPLNTSLNNFKNKFGGIHLYAGVGPVSGNIIRDNVVSNNSAMAIQLNGADNTEILNNLIGTNQFGTALLKNGGSGIMVNSIAAGNNGAESNRIVGNTISGNTYSGITLAGYNTKNNVIQGNYIGTNSNFSTTLGNAFSGILIEGAASNNLIGGGASSEANFIAHNGHNGILVTGAPISNLSDPETDHNIFLGNSIYANGFLAIDLSPYDGFTAWISGATANDLNDIDDGPNSQINFPIIATASSDGTSTKIVANLDAKTNSFYRIEFFSNSSLDSSGYGEGKTYLGSKDVATDSLGKSTVMFTDLTASAVGSFITATATRTNSSFDVLASGSTSEFSLGKVVTAAPIGTSMNRIDIHFNEHALLPPYNVNQDLQVANLAVFTYGLNSSSDVGFTVDSVTGMLSLTNPTDYETLIADQSKDNLLWVNVTVTDGNFETVLYYSFVTSDINETPSIVGSSEIVAFEDSSVLLSGLNSITVSDVDTLTASNTQNMRVTITTRSATNALIGTINYTNTLPGILSVPSANKLVLVGSLQDVNAALQTVSIQPNLNDTQEMSVVITVEDLGSGIAGANNEQNSQIVKIRYAPINDAPILATNPSLVTDEDVPIFFSDGNAWVVSDVDSNSFTLSIDISNGTLKWHGVSGVPEGVDLSSPNGITLSGTATEINEWASKISFAPNAEFSGSANVRWTLHDDGTTPQSIVANSSIFVKSVNDAPTVEIGQSSSLDQGRLTQITPAQTRAKDIDNAASELTYRLVTMPSSGTLLLNGQTMNRFSAFTQADIDDGMVQYKHDGSVSESDDFSFVVFDSAGASTTTKTVKVNIKVSPVVILPNSTLPSTFSTQTIGSSDSANSSDLPVRGFDVKSTQTSPNGIETSSAVGTAVGNPNNAPNSPKMAAKASVATVANPALAADVSSTSNSNINNLGARMIDLDRFADDKIRSNSKQTEGLLTGQSMRLDSANSPGFSRARTAAETLEYVQIVRTALTDRGFINDVSKVGDDVKQTINIDRNVVASTTAVSAGLSIGYVIWLVRGGALLSSLLASIPAWRVMDPLPILGNMGDNEDQSDDESLDAMIDRAKQKRVQTALSDA
jgi:hypothetical protein